MADFLAAFTSGVSLQEWSDPALGSLPSRTNPRSGFPHRRRVASVGATVVVTANVDGVTGPADSALDGRLFTAAFIDHPGTLPTLTGGNGKSSVQTFRADVAGHYSLIVRREGGGGVILHLDAE
jgi:hypothetical protein